MQLIQKPFTFGIYTLPEHSKFKKSLLERLHGEAHNNVTLTDWHLPDSRCLDLIREPLENSTIRAFASLGYSVNFGKMWFQQYKTNSQHEWHTHRGAHYSCIYYLELPPGTPFTEFKNMHNDETYSIPVQEGDILAAPAFLMHRSPQNTSEHRKTIIAFNINLYVKTLVS